MMPVNMGGKLPRRPAARTLSSLMPSSRPSDAEDRAPASPLQPPLVPRARRPVGSQRRSLALRRRALPVRPLPAAPLAVGAMAHRRHVHALGPAEPVLVLVASASAEGAALVEADAHLFQSVAG